jgi:hypothetical protein
MDAIVAPETEPVFRILSFSSMLTDMKIEWRRGFFRAWVVLALAWIGLTGWNEYLKWDNYLISLSRGFPSFPHDYAQLTNV